MTRDLIIYLTEKQHDRLYNFIKDNQDLEDIIKAVCDAEYCECFECCNNGIGA